MGGCRAFSFRGFEAEATPWRSGCEQNLDEMAWGSKGRPRCTMLTGPIWLEEFVLPGFTSMRGLGGELHYFTVHSLMYGMSYGLGRFLK